MLAPEELAPEELALVGETLTNDDLQEKHARSAKENERLAVTHARSANEHERLAATHRAKSIENDKELVALWLKKEPLQTAEGLAAIEPYLKQLEQAYYAYNVAYKRKRCGINEADSIVREAASQASNRYRKRLIYTIYTAGKVTVRQSEVYIYTWS